ncbi:MAG: glutamine synthetase III [Bacteroidales bacterium]
MGTLRFKAIEKAISRHPLEVDPPSVKTSEYYAVNVFNKKKMQEYLSREAFNSVMEAIDKGTKVDRKVSNQIASGMKAWAIDRGATHYTHWFHPLTGATAEKHDAFFEPASDASVIENFDGGKLVQQEPDASSLPSGGMRNTFEARGYTAWDPSSPAFVIGRTLCIPSVYISFKGDSLDYKTPLLKSIEAIDKAAVELCNYFDKNVTRVNVGLGCEQEYFLVDDALFNARPDLKLTDRTLMGHSSAKDQQLADHYFGYIPMRVAAFMHEFEIESYKLGIPIKTRHNEVAPNQYECAPVFEEVNLAVDHNQLLMTIMRRVARKHNFRVLFHEKPYKDINGSGKHCNWSLITNTGVNLLSPGKTPKNNMLFLAFFVSVIRGVFKYQDLLRSSIVSLGNEHRLGASEAPPAIMSVFLGEEMNKILDEIETRVSGRKMSPDEKTELKLDVGKIPEIMPDNTDRNRTSPFAFTGNRFEFRAVGSSANVALPMIAIHTIVAKQLKEFKIEVDKLIEKGVKKDEAVFQVIKKFILESRNGRFDGNNYSDEWKKEAEKRGLTNVSDVLEALSALVSAKSKDVFSEMNVFTARELEARLEIDIEKYTKKLQIEARVLGDLAINHILPTVYRYQNVLIENVKGLKDLFNDSEFEKLSGNQLSSIKEISSRAAMVNIKVNNMIDERRKANVIEDGHKKAREYADNVKPYLEEIRYQIDHLEMIVDDETWPLPKYRELLFIR